MRYAVVQHFMGRGHRGKAMYVAVDRATAIKMHDKVKAEWQKHIDALKAQLPNAQGDELLVLKDKIEFMEETDMAVVVSSGQNEVAEMRTLAQPVNTAWRNRSSAIIQGHLPCKMLLHINSVLLFHFL